MAQSVTKSSADVQMAVAPVVDGKEAKGTKDAKEQIIRMTDSKDAKELKDVKDTREVVKEVKVPQKQGGQGGRQASPSLSLRLTKTRVSLLNAVRGTLLTRIPTLAIDSVKVHTNQSHTAHDLLKHQLSCLAVRSDGVHRFKAPAECKSSHPTADFCDKCAVQISLDYLNQTSTNQWVTSQHFGTAWKPGFVVSDPINLVSIAPGCRLKLDALVRRGIPLEHARWTAVRSVTIRPVPAVTLDTQLESKLSDQQRKAFVSLCPGRVFDWSPAIKASETKASETKASETKASETKAPSAKSPSTKSSATVDMEDLVPAQSRLIVKQVAGCIACLECKNQAVDIGLPGLVKLQDETDDRIVEIETNGKRSALDCWTEAIGLLPEMFQRLKESLG